ncbi:MAG: cadherin repeat domain-containing protein, partial [Planctomycetia bacterium]
MRLAGRIINENMPAGTVVGRFSTVDPDRDELFTYTLVSGRGSRDNAAFAIRDGQLVATESFNFEMRRAYSIRVRSTDRGGLSVERVFVIRVRNVPEPRTPAALTLPTAFAAVAGARTALVFSQAPLSDANP